MYALPQSIHHQELRRRLQALKLNSFRRTNHATPIKTFTGIFCLAESIAAGNDVVHLLHRSQRTLKVLYHRKLPMFFLMCALRT